MICMKKTRVLVIWHKLLNLLEDFSISTKKKMKTQLAAIQIPDVATKTRRLETSSGHLRGFTILIHRSTVIAKS